MGTVYLCRAAGPGQADSDQSDGAQVDGAQVSRAQVRGGSADGGRLVAVKVVRAELADDPAYRARFRREGEVARRVARFCTAEVLDIVDPPDGPPYLVTEFIAGPTLTDAVATGGPLGSADVERVAVSVAAALTAIHGAGLVHRDLKPSNVLLSPLGPRVIDFGVAWAADSVTITRDTAVGTPAFMAPEQARGEPVSPAADVFAWGGLTVFASTGRPPFGTGTIPALLYRIVTTDVVLDGVDPALVPIVREAMRRDPADRPTAEEIFRQLIRLGAQLSSTVGPGTPVAGPAGAGAAALGAFESGGLMDVAVDSAADVTSVRPAVGGRGLPGDVRAPGPVSVAADRSRQAGGPDGSRRSGGPDRPHRPARRRSALLVTITALSVLLALAAAALALRGTLGDRGGTDRISANLTVPDGLIGLRGDDAEVRLRTAGFTAIRRVTKRDAEAPVGTVIDVNPASGSDIDRATTVTLTLSAGDEDVVVPEVVGQTETAARAALERLGLTVTVRSRAAASGAAATGGAVRTGRVSQVEPSAGSTVPAGSTVTIVVSGPATDSAAATVPDVVGRPSQQAVQLLTTIGFTNVTFAFAPADQAADTVTGSDPVAGAKTKLNALLTLTVSTGPEHTTITDVVGRTELDARTALETAGLVVTVRTQNGPSSYGPGTVEAVNPAVGTQVAPRTNVTITVVSTQVTVPDVVGQARADAESTLRGYGLDVVVRREDSGRPVGTVLAQSPEAGTVRRGTTVTITVAKVASGSDVPPLTTPPPPPPAAS
jgi:beta-lactam-binding protein with PASTA domain